LPLLDQFICVILGPLFGEYLFVLILRVPSRYLISLFVLILRVPLLLLDQFICVILRPFREYLLVVPPPEFPCAVICVIIRVPS
jgi:hypothetical protein